MAQEYYNLETAAGVLGVYPAELNEMRERGEVRAFRDSGNWKFKKEEIDNLAIERRSKKTAPAEDEDDSQDVLLSEVELGASDPSSSGTVIGSGEQSPEDSDIKLAGSDIGFDTGDELKEESGLEEIDLTVDDEVPLEDSQIPLSDADRVVSAGSGDSAIELADGIEDDDLLLGGSGSGSDITIGQDSGISLVDPHDSGLALDEPLELTSASDDESLALGDDDMLTLSEDADTEAPTELKTDDDFLLTPLEEMGDEEDSESGSQVIALDDAAEVVEEAPAMAAMLDEDLAGADAAAPVFEAGPLGGGQQLAAAGAPLAPGAAALPEAPYGKLAMAGLIGCMMLLTLSGTMAYDLMRNMWSWNGAYSVNSSLMDMVLGLFGG
ncbi:MAG: helix-turn-helix domain-containing protein [Planctomycetota bacterium]